MKEIFKILVFSFVALTLKAQSIDKVEAIIGDEIILRSDIESQYLQYLSQGNVTSESVKCEIIEDILFQKLLINQAKLDSIEVSEEEVESEILNRLNYFESQLGSIEKVEEYFGKSKAEIELELGKVIQDQFLAQKMQGTISNDVKVTPAKVRDFFNNQNKSDIPLIPTKVEISHIVIKPEITDEQEDKIRTKLNSFRDRIYKGEDFKMLATLYSDDPGSAAEGGELGFVSRGDLVPEFERAAFKLKIGEISEVIESQFGFHIVQLIERRGEQINVRHILLKTRVSSTALHNTKLKAEEIEQEIKDGKISFDQAIEKYSDDESKNNNGLLLNPNTMSTMHTFDDMSPILKFVVEKLSVGNISKPTVIQLADETKAYRILRLNKKIDSHLANLVDDFSMIKELAIKIKQQEKISNWIDKTLDKTYIKLNDSITECKFKNKWIK